MGKTQSKRSVDITTESKKSPEEEVPGKLEKIEDLDQKQVNGDASSQENAETEKKEGDEPENDKDLTTEKSGGESGAQDGGGDSNTGQCSASTVESVSKDDDSAASKDGTKTSEEISPLADETNKKPKKEKVKKKWSFRSISFGKKDKQKPAKSEDAATENATTTNGDGSAHGGEETSDKNQQNETAADSEAKSSSEKPAENGDASEKEMNGDKTSTATTPIEEQPTKEIASNENTTNITNNTTETTSSALAENNTTTATENNQTEKQTTTTATKLAVETTESLTTTMTTASNGAAIEKNGTETLTADEQNDHQVTAKAANLIGEASEVTAEKIKSIPNIANDIIADKNGVHQNGMSADGEELENENESKSQVEVIFQTDQSAHSDDLFTLTATATASSSPKTTPILIPDPNNTDSTKIENSSKCVIRDSNDTDKFEEATTVAAENAAINVEDVALKAIEPVSTSIFSSDTQTIEVVNVDTGNEEPTEPQSCLIEKNADQRLPEKQCEEVNEDLSRAVNEIITAQDESPNPPPLPVSPPPSQVSVFAFNDNNQAVEEEEERISNTTHTDIIAESVTSQSTSEVLLTDAHNVPDYSQSCTDGKLVDKEDATCELSSPEYDTKTGNPAQVIQQERNIDNISTESLENCITPQMEVENNFNVVTATNLTVLTPSDSIDENTENELIKTATAVVNEISEKAVELIQQQTDLQLQQIEVEESNDDLKTDNTTIEINYHVNDIENNEISMRSKCDSTEEVINVMESLNINCEDTNLLKNEKSLDELESNLIDCIKATDKHILVEEEKEITTDICSESVVSVNDGNNQN
ncbi:A-kinase anchor protein 200 [Eurosta solidaginis]|uniref:A-kinase anchor protein 200 n=1 Tax=Eurosta solidaginis TaxID=178769 RepID=UPI003530F345